MYKNKKISVVIRAFNEEKFISSVVNSIPDFVDRIYVVNDASTDRTFEILSSQCQRENRLSIITNKIRMGAGAAGITGLKQALQEDADIIAMIDGDGQMTPSILYRFLDPLVSGKGDYTKGNRFSQREHWKEMPVWRAFGNILLTKLTRLASGYWHISDPQNGYIAVCKETLIKIDLDKINKGYAFENDMLVKLNVVGAKVLDIPHPAVYRGQHSKIIYPSFMLKTSWLLLKDFAWRINIQYLQKRKAKLKKQVNRH